MNPQPQKIVSSVIGYLLIPDGPIDIDYSNIELSDNNFGVDILFNKPIVVREIDLTHLDSNRQMAMLTNTIIRYIEHNRICEALVAVYKTVQEGHDVKLVCGVYKK